MSSKATEDDGLSSRVELSPNGNQQNPIGGGSTSGLCLLRRSASSASTASSDYAEVSEEEQQEGSALRRSYSPNPETISCGVRRWLLRFGVVVALCGGSVAVWALRDEVLQLCEWLGTRPLWEGGVTYSTLLTFWLVALMPTSLLEIAAGFVFGFWPATLFSTVGKASGSFISFGIARHYKECAREKLIAERDPGYFGGLALSIRAQPFATCLALRLAYVPEAVQNFIPAILDAPFDRFAAATLLGSSMYAALWSRLGASMGDARNVAADGWSPEKVTFLVVGLFSLALLLTVIHCNTKRLIRRLSAMDEAGNPGDDDELDHNPGLVALTSTPQTLAIDAV